MKNNPSKDEMRDGLRELVRFGDRAGDVSDILRNGDNIEELEVEDRKD